MAKRSEREQELVWKILLVEDDEDDYLLTRKMLEDVKPGKFTLDWANTYSAALKILEKANPDVALVDYQLGTRTGVDLVREMAERDIKIPVIFLTGQGSLDVDLEAMQAGAADYLVKTEVTPPLLERSIRYAIENSRLYMEQARRVRELDALQRATSVLLSTLELEPLLGQILDAALSALPSAEGASLSLMAPDSSEFHVSSVQTDTDERIHSTDLTMLKGFDLKAVRERRPLLINQNLKGETSVIEPGKPDAKLPTPTKNPHPQTELSEGGATIEAEVVWGSSLLAPMILADQVIGMLSLTSSRPNAFSEEDLRLLVSFAATTTNAIQNARLHAEVQQMAVTDALTGLYNRHGLFELGQRELDRAHRYGRPLTAMMVDVDHFKKVNDHFGHTVGDFVLSTIAVRMRNSVRELDILGRYGGDEFIILLPETDLFTACLVADRILERINEPLALPEIGNLEVSVSIGVARATYGIRQLAKLIDRADAAAYLAKEKGRNRVEINYSA